MTDRVRYGIFIALVMVPLAMAQETIEEAIDRLGSEDVQERTTAERTLESMGDDRLDRLREALRSRKNPVIQARLREIIARKEEGIRERKKFAFSPLRFRVLAGEEMQSSEADRKKETGESYVPPRGHLWVPVIPDAQEEFGKEVLLELDQENWTFDKIGEMSLREVPEVAATFRIAGAENRRRFGDFTGRNTGRKMAILYHGQLVSAPVIQDRIEGAGILVGLTHAQAKDLVDLFNREKAKDE